MYVSRILRIYLLLILNIYSTTSKYIGFMLSTNNNICSPHSIKSDIIHGSSHSGSLVTNQTSIHEKDVGSIPGLSQGVKDPGLP